MADDGIHPCKKFFLLILLIAVSGVVFLGSVFSLAGGSGMFNLNAQTALYGGLCSDVTDGSDVSDKNITKATAWGQLPKESKKCPQADKWAYAKFFANGAEMRNAVGLNKTCDMWVEGENKDLFEDLAGKDADKRKAAQDKMALIQRGCGKTGYTGNNPSKTAMPTMGEYYSQMTGAAFFLPFLATLFATAHAAVTNLPFCNKGKSGLILNTAVFLGGALALNIYSWDTTLGMALSLGATGGSDCTKGGALAIEDATYFGTADDIYRCNNDKENKAKACSDGIGLLGWKGMSVDTFDKEYVAKYKELTPLEKYYFLNGGSIKCSNDIDSTAGVASKSHTEFKGAASLAVAGSVIASLGIVCLMMITGWLFKQLNDNAPGDDAA